MSRTNSTLTQERLKELVHYDPESGAFSRLKNIRKDGKVGSIRPDGYLTLCVDGTIYTAHRIAFLYMNGKWPTHDVDHIDGNKLNNRWNNLRDTPTEINCQNRRKPQKNSIHGVLGVRSVTKSKTWAARITVNGKTRHLGCYSTQEEASAAYLEAKRRLHSGCTI